MAMIKKRVRFVHLLGGETVCVFLDDKTKGAHFACILDRSYRWAWVPAEWIDRSPDAELIHYHAYVRQLTKMNVKIQIARKRRKHNAETKTDCASQS